MNPRERAEWVRLLEEEGEASGFEASLRRKDGTIRHALLSSRTVEIDGQRCILTITRDVTERRRMEAALRESEARYREIFENTSDGIIVVEVCRERALFWLLGMNPPRKRKLGTTGAAAQGKFTDEILLRGDRGKAARRHSTLHRVRRA